MADLGFLSRAILFFMIRFQSKNYKIDIFLLHKKIKFHPKVAIENRSMKIAVTLECKAFPSGI